MEMLQKLGEEHRNMARLLEVLQDQLDVFSSGGHPDYDVLTSAAEYFMGFPDQCHHPKEDMILRRMRERDPDAAETVGELESDHEGIAILARRFSEAVERVLQESEMPRSVFVATLKEFIDTQREHMEMERDRFFPLAQAVLTQQDWQELGKAAGDERDPLYSEEGAEEFEALRRAIMRWHAEDQSGTQ